MMFNSQCYHPRLCVYEGPLLTVTLINCVQGEHLGGRAISPHPSRGEGPLLLGG